MPFITADVQNIFAIQFGMFILHYLLHQEDKLVKTYINVFHINTVHAYYHIYRMHNQLAYFCLQTGG